MARTLPLLVATLLPALLGPTVAGAQARSPAPDLQQFKPALDMDGFAVVHDATLLPQFRVGVGGVFGVAVHPLEVQAEGYGRQFGIVDSIISLDLAGAFGIFDWWEVGGVLPIMQIPVETDFIRAVGGRKVDYSLGDLRLETRLRPLDPAVHKLGLAGRLFLTLPTGDERAGMGRGGVGGGGSLILSQGWSRFRFAVNVGFGLYPEATVVNLTTSHELTYGAAVGVSPIVDVLDVNLELDGSLTGGPSALGQERFGDSAHSPLELLVTVRGHLPHHFSVFGGVGKGLTAGFGSPELRFFAGLTWAIREPVDRDRDGLANRKDSCPDDPEDYDDFRDDDGCPDPDNDGDGVLDEADRCPDGPEDLDGWQDEDGCPEPDNDLDGLADLIDVCPVEAEDPDGWVDTDGCPDPDNDGDGVLDVSDSCPNEAEDLDGWEDADGCPDPDDDGDGIADGDDLCPREPENVNGIRDEDGCPDEKLAVRTRDRIVIMEKVYFASGRDSILKRSDPVLAAVAEILKDTPSIRRVRIEGHTDSVGEDRSNLDLSDRRARSVMNRLVRLGIAGVRLEALGFGENRPIASNDDEEGRQRNRRVEFHIAESEAAPTEPTPAPQTPDPWGFPPPPAPEATPSDPWGAPAGGDVPGGSPAPSGADPWGGSSAPVPTSPAPTGDPWAAYGSSPAPAPTASPEGPGDPWATPTGASNLDPWDAPAAPEPPSDPWGGSAPGESVPSPEPEPTATPAPAESPWSLPKRAAPPPKLEDTRDPWGKQDDQKDEEESEQDGE